MLLLLVEVAAAVVEVEVAVVVIGNQIDIFNRNHSMGKFSRW